MTEPEAIKPRRAVGDRAQNLVSLYFQNQRATFAGSEYELTERGLRMFGKSEFEIGTELEVEIQVTKGHAEVGHRVKCVGIVVACEKRDADGDVYETQLFFLELPTETKENINKTIPYFTSPRLRD
ncbi:MAG: hypothetical protein SGI71_00930 [Verrucomicrobiota bacterium]|nr:hypothetical protein [Verrucomicrobiota bacterium]